MIPAGWEERGIKGNNNDKYVFSRLYFPHCSLIFSIILQDYGSLVAEE